MKELSTEDKAQRYDETIERAKKIHKYSSDPAEIKRMEQIFPELKESDDKRIIKRIIHALHGDVLDMEETTKAIAWLEKQGEQKPIMNVPSREVILAIWDLGNEWKDRTCGSISTKYGTQLDYIQKHWHESEYYLREKKGEKKPINNQLITEQAGVIDKYIDKFNKQNKFNEQKLADKIKPKFKVGDWVKVSTIKGDRVVKIASVEYFKDGHPSYITTEGRWFGNGTKACLLTDKDVETITIPESKIIVSQNPAEWSEEDIKMFVNIKACLRNSKKDYSREINWLKSLKDRYIWNPSNEQMKALNAINVTGDISYVGQAQELIDLYNDLKKLK